MSRHSCQMKAKSLFSATVVWAGAVMLLGATDCARASLVASRATPTSVTLTWNAPGDGCSGTVSQYDFRYATAMITETNWVSALQVSNEPSPLAAGTVQTLTITGLSPNTAYYFSAKVADQVPNWSVLSSVVMKTTPSDTTRPAAVIDLAANASGAGSISLTWTAPSDDGGVGTATTYDIRYSVSMITSANFTAATMGPVSQPREWSEVSRPLL